MSVLVYQSMPSHSRINAAILDLIEKQSGQFRTVYWLAADNTTIKRATFAPAHAAAHLAPIVSAKAAQATATRAVNNPNLVNRWCNVRERWVSFDVSRVLVVTSERSNHTFRFTRDCSSFEAIVAAAEKPETPRAKAKRKASATVEAHV